MAIDEQRGLDVVGGLGALSGTDVLQRRSTFSPSANPQPNKAPVKEPPGNKPPAEKDPPSKEPPVKEPKQ